MVRAKGTTAADELLAETVAGLPVREHGYLLPTGVPLSVPFARVQDADWLNTQIGLQARRWPTAERRVLATLWWYSVSQVFLTPTIASLFVTGRALSPRPDDVQLHWLPDGRVFTARSTVVLEAGAGEKDGAAACLETVAAALRDSFEIAIPAVAGAGARRERPLWAIGTDSLANRLLWVGRAHGEIDRATSLARELVELIGAPMPVPRVVDVDRRPPRTGKARFVRRGSCCLVYLEPGQPKCASCPRLAAQDRRTALESAADHA
ncbi:(2Fe-2S)-binding protein [soil metagenome]